MKISTGSGDRGMTSLFSGERVPKSHVRIEAAGDVDELNSVLGAVAAGLFQLQPDMVRDIRQIQARLMTIGSCLATTDESPIIDRLERISDESIRTLESVIERLEDELPELKGFILPSGHITAAWAHVARTVCRRAERRVVALLEKSTSDSTAEPLRNAMVYLNRLSDFLFLLARRCNQVGRVPEVLWP